MNILFICNQNRHRSKTAELIFKDPFNTGSAGLYCESPVTLEQLEWADVIFVMEDAQRAELGRRFPTAYLQKQIISLDISDEYSFMQPGLVSELREKVNAILANHQIVFPLHT